MQTEKDLSAYIEKLSEIAKEKSLLGATSEAAEYFLKANELAKSCEDFLKISKAIYYSDLENNKSLAYACFITALEHAANPIKEFKRYKNQPGMALMISEFQIKMADHLFHFLIDTAQNIDEEMLISEYFENLSPFISDPDPLFFLQQQYKSAS